MRGARAVEDALFNQENRITKGIAVEDRAAHATACARAGNQKAVDVLAHQVGDQMRAKKSAGARFTDNELALSRLDHLGKLSRQPLEVGVIDAALGGVAEGGFEVGVTS